MKRGTFGWGRTYIDEPLDADVPMSPWERHTIIVALALTPPSVIASIIAIGTIGWSAWPILFAPCATGIAAAWSFFHYRSRVFVRHQMRERQRLAQGP